MISGDVLDAGHTTLFPVQHQIQKEPYRDAGRPLCQEGLGFVKPGGTGDVDMDPRGYRRHP